MITQERLKELLDYDSDTGVFTWKKRPVEMFSHCKYPEGICTTWNKRFAGSHPGTNDADGYLIFRVDYKIYKAHRLAWLYVYGDLPDCDIDHKDRDRSNNRIGNLRVATRSENLGNSALNSRNTTGYKGVMYLKNKGKYVANIFHKGMNYRLGTFTDPADAHRAYCGAADLLFGEFACQG